MRIKQITLSFEYWIPRTMEISRRLFCVFYPRQIWNVYELSFLDFSVLCFKFFQKKKKKYGWMTGWIGKIYMMDRWMILLIANTYQDTGPCLLWRVAQQAPSSWAARISFEAWGRNLPPGHDSPALAGHRALAALSLAFKLQKEKDHWFTAFRSINWYFS